MREGDLEPLRCTPEALASLATGLSRFGPAEGDPDWLVSAVWLCTGDRSYLATSFTNVLADGYVARPLHIHTPHEFAGAVEAEMPDIKDRLRSRGNNVALPDVGEDWGPPDTLQAWSTRDYTATVLVRVAERLLTTRRVACGLLFESEDGPSLLVGTDTGSMAMVLSEDEALIRNYCKTCEAVPAAEFSSFA